METLNSRIAKSKQFKSLITKDFKINNIQAHGKMKPILVECTYNMIKRWPVG